MKQYSYFLFPVFFIVIGILGIGFSLYSLIFIVDFSNLTEEYHSLVGALGFGLIGGIFITFKGRFSIDLVKMQIVKEYRMFGFKLSREEVKIPPSTSQVMIKQKSKEGRGYIQGAVGFGYKIKSCDVYFESNNRMIRIINTDYKRAIKIAELLKETLSIDYLIK
jgi:hypothetical protein